MYWRTYLEHIKYRKIVGRPRLAAPRQEPQPPLSVLGVSGCGPWGLAELVRCMYVLVQFSL